MKSNRRTVLALSLMTAVACSLCAFAASAVAATAQDLDRDSAQALQALYKTSSVASDISKHAKAVLVFPNMVKAGRVF
jgi:lipid-binding SYLF domain-containing protein